MCPRPGAHKKTSAAHIGHLEHTTPLDQTRQKDTLQTNPVHQFSSSLKQSTLLRYTQVTVTLKFLTPCRTTIMFEEKHYRMVNPPNEAFIPQEIKNVPADHIGA